MGYRSQKKNTDSTRRENGDLISRGRIGRWQLRLRVGYGIGARTFVERISYRIAKNIIRQGRLDGEFSVLCPSNSKKAKLKRL